MNFHYLIYFSHSSHSKSHKWAENLCYILIIIFNLSSWMDLKCLDWITINSKSCSWTLDITFNMSFSNEPCQYISHISCYITLEINPLRTELFSIEKWFFNHSVIFGSKWSDKNLMIMHREKRGKNHALVYSSRKRKTSEKDLTGRKREKTCMRWQVGDLFNLKIITVYYTANIFFTEK